MRDALAERPVGDLRLQRVDRDRHAQLDHGRQHGLQPRQFLLEGDGLGAAVGPGGFGADVDDVGAFLDHPLGMLERDGRIEELAAVGEGVRGDVEDPHDDGAVLAPAAGRACSADGRQAAIGPMGLRQANLSPPSSSWRVALRAARGGVKRLDREELLSR